MIALKCTHILPGLGNENTRSCKTNLETCFCYPYSNENGLQFWEVLPVMQFFKPVQKNVVDPLSLVLNIKVAKNFDRFFCLFLCLSLSWLVGVGVEDKRGA